MRPFVFLLIAFSVAGGLKAQLAAAPPAQNVSAQTAQTPAQQGTAAPPATKDPQAVSVLNQALAVAGGSSAIKAITDYSATGSVSYYGDSPVQGTVTLKALKMNQFRRDTTLPTGTRSWAMTYLHANTKDENGAIRPVLPQVPISASGFVLPARYIASTLRAPQLGISDQGIVQVDGHSAHDVRVQLPYPGNPSAKPQPREFRTIDFFIDASTFQVLMSEELLSKGVLHEIHYSNYQPVNGILVPFTIGEDYFGHQNCLIQLTQVSLNTGLADSVFQLQ